METTERPGAKRYPLHMTISVAFTVLLALFGFALIGFNYLEGRKAALVGADELLDRIDAHMQISVEDLYAPVQNIVDVASKTLPSNSDSDEHGVQTLGFAAEVLRIKPEISSIFVGYDDGDFYLLRHVSSWPETGNVVDVPEGTTLILENIEREDSEPVRQDWLFYDDDLRLIGRETTPWTGFDPRTRDWFQSAMSTRGQIASDFYRFFTTGEIGVTIARRLTGDGGVVGADLTLKELSAGLAGQHPTPTTRLAMLTPDGYVIALPDMAEELTALQLPVDGEVRMPHVTDLTDPLYHRLADHLAAGSPAGRFDLKSEERTWLISLSKLPTRWGESIVLATIVPRDELLADVNRVRNQSVLMSLGLLLVTLLVVLVLSRHISRSLRTLAREAEHIRELRLDRPLTVRSTIEEVDDLASTMAVMKSSLQQFLAISQALSAEKNFDRLLEMILEETRRVSGAEAGAVLLRSEDDSRLDLAILQLPETLQTAQGPDDRTARTRPVQLDTDDEKSQTLVERLTVTEGSVVRIDDVWGEHGYDVQSIRERFESESTPVRSVLSVPLINQQDEIIGVLQLINARGRTGAAVGFPDETVPYIEALSSNAAVALHNRRLLKAQKDLLESFIQLVAGAIDAKSPYTHGHCQRVPEIARMLAHAAHTSDHGPFAKFRLSDDDRYALHLASWLHDCGKVTTPEYVVDKATKLETLYDRIHEIRMRFEVLLRDAEIDYLEDLKAGRESEDELRSQLEKKREEIRGDFEFVAECNSGDVPMTDERIERIRTIGARTWMRHLDDRLGLSHGELTRRGGEFGKTLPTTEPVLADRPEHVVTRGKGVHPFGDNGHAFKMDVPEHLYNLGEIHNLCIGRGTLTNEERFKINEHVIQTIRMLERLPFPRELSQVPDWAGNHHEKLDGTGYPRRLPAEELSIPERIMALADIFEALTATDRPYMPPKTLSRAIGIMRSMAGQGHLCPDLLELFLRSGVYREYAERFLKPEQLDDVAVDELFGGERSVERAS